MLTLNDSGILHNGGESRMEFDLAKAELEHIMPEKIIDTQWDTYFKNEITEPKCSEALIRSQYHLDNLTKIGNLTLLPPGVNNSIKNSAFMEKRNQAYDNSQIKITQGLRDYTKWDHKTIKIRQDKLAIDAADIWKL